MKKIKSASTGAEVVLRKALWSKGLRFRICDLRYVGKPDIILPASRVAVFVDGDFWHGNQWVKRSHKSLEDQFRQSSSRDYWLRKIRSNMDRDARVTSELMDQGWKVVRFWESDVLHNLAHCVQITEDAVKCNTDPTSISLIPKMTFADFFAGIGLMRMGLERQGWKVDFANDIDQEKFEMYSGHFTDANDHYVVENVHSLNVSDVPSVTLATACFPCNDLSLAGSRSGLEGKNSSAFWGFIRIVEEMGVRRPPLIILENVTGFLSSNGGSDFQTVLLELNRLGYVTDSFVIDASHFVPQSRQRLFVIGALNVSWLNRFKSPSDLQPTDHRPKALIEFMRTHPEIGWNVRPLPELPKRSKRLASVLQNLSESSPTWWDEKRAKYLFNQMSPRHKQIALQMINSEKWSYGTVFRRVRNSKSMAELRTDGVAGCLRTPRGGSGRQILFKAGKGKYMVRLLTPIECARLMGADEYIIAGPLNRALFGFGDAVCVPVVEWIAKYYLNPLVNELLHGHPLKSFPQQDKECSVHQKKSTKTSV